MKARPTSAKASDLDRLVAETAARVADSTIAALRSMFSEPFIRGVIEREAKIAVQAALLAEAERTRISKPVTLPAVVVEQAPRRPAPEAAPGPDQAPPLAYRPREAAAALSVSQATIYELIAIGALSARKLGSATIILRSDIDAYLAALPLMVSASKAALEKTR
ncbi:helix-turn-helix domain-containing protein [Methylobacterium sp. WL6]|uniref:helix-turn-helix domain-containing protein n=1 Tax=Methylobacterium sp. WL6 TaxID=2603901 RepID=UPI001FEE07C7|nr:helix-turn-helix domain-containing protein [Methylobacterium sp. WL6]